MIACRAISTVALYVLAAGGSVSTAAAQPASRNTPLSVEEVVQMTQSGVSEDLMITSIKKNGKPFDLNTDEILELRKSGVSDTVIKFLLDPSQPYTPAPPPVKPPDAQTKPVPAKKYPADAYASRVPPEPGLYCFPQDSPLRADIKILLGEQSGAGLGKVVMKKGKGIAYLVGPAAKVRAAEGTPVFYIRLPDGKSIEELLLVAFDHKNGRRDLDIGPSGPKPESLRQFDSLEVGAGLYRLNPVKLIRGEYMFYLIGTADPSKGNFGKGYDFGTDAAATGKR